MRSNETKNNWSYELAFCRNLGLISPDEQVVLRNSRIAVAGLGGVGGIDLVTLARLGIGKFTIADPDIFETPNTNRQYGSTYSTRGLKKAEVMANIIRDINPEAEIRIIAEALGTHNADEFLEGVDILIDGIDAFEIDLRQLLFHKAKAKGIYALGAGPFGFSTAWVIFSPNGISFDHYFDLSDSQKPMEKFVAYIVGMAPASLQRSYLDLAYVNIAERRGPSAGLACHLAAGVATAEVIKILLNRGRIFPAPYYHQFDAYLGKYIRGRLRWGNRGPLQKLKRQWLYNFINRNINLSKEKVHEQGRE